MLTWHALIDFCYVNPSKNGVYGTPEVRKANQRILRHVKVIKSERVFSIQLKPATSRPMTLSSNEKSKKKNYLFCFLMLWN